MKSVTTCVDDLLHMKVRMYASAGCAYSMLSTSGLLDLLQAIDKWHALTSEGSTLFLPACVLCIAWRIERRKGAEVQRQHCEFDTADSVADRAS